MSCEVMLLNGKALHKTFATFGSIKMVSIHQSLTNNVVILYLGFLFVFPILEMYLSDVNNLQSGQCGKNRHYLKSETEFVLLIPTS